MLKRIENWLLKPAKTNLDVVQITSTAFLLNMLWLMLIILILTFINTREAWQYQALFYGCIIAPLWEELAFRVLPVKIAQGVNPKLIIPVLALSSLIFGWGHAGPKLSGPDALLIQGVGGIFLSVVYLKTNFNYWAVVAMHAAWNFWIYFL